MRPLRTILLIAVCLAPLIGCGGGSPSRSWRVEADAICRSYRGVAAALQAEIDVLVRTGVRTPRERAAVAAILRRALPHLHDEIAQLRELDRSADENPKAAADLLGLMEMRHLIVGGLIEAFESGDAARTVTVIENLVANEELAGRIARRAGLRVCGHL